MTPKRKQALQWFHDQGEIACKKAQAEMPITMRMVALMLNDRHLVAYRTCGKYHYSLTDAGRVALHES